MSENMMSNEEVNRLLGEMIEYFASKRADVSEATIEYFASRRGDVNDSVIFKVPPQYFELNMALKRRGELPLRIDDPRIQQRMKEIMLEKLKPLLDEMIEYFASKRVEANDRGIIKIPHEYYDLNWALSEIGEPPLVINGPRIQQRMEEIRGEKAENSERAIEGDQPNYKQNGGKSGISMSGVLRAAFEKGGNLTNEDFEHTKETLKDGPEREAESITKD